jgi:hypothetical protein
MLTGFFFFALTPSALRSKFTARLFYNPRVEFLDALPFRWTPLL